MTNSAFLLFLALVVKVTLLKEQATTANRDGEKLPELSSSNCLGDFFIFQLVTEIEKLQKSFEIF